MGYCPTCRKSWEGDLSTCPICGRDLDTDTEDRWLMIGSIDDKLSADLARETLSAYNIPAVVISKSGFFGNIGLTLNPFYDHKRVATFTVSVPEQCAEEAADLLSATIGSAWHPTEESANED